MADKSSEVPAVHCTSSCCLKKSEFMQIWHVNRVKNTEKYVLNLNLNASEGTKNLN